MPPKAVLETVKKIDGVAIFADLAALPADEALKKSKTRHRNQKTAAAKKAGTVTPPRGKRSTVPSSRTLAKLGVTDTPAAKALTDRHREALKAHDEKLKAYTKQHAVERAELDAAHTRRLAAADKLLQMLALAHDLPDNEKMVAELQARIDAIE